MSMLSSTAEIKRRRIWRNMLGDVGISSLRRLSVQRLFFKCVLARKGEGVGIAECERRP